MSSDKQLEKLIIERYTLMKSSMLGISKKEAHSIVVDMVEAAKQKVKEYGFDKLPENFGDFILQEEKKNPSHFNMNIKRGEGVQDADIRWFWNMPSLERCLLEVDDENSRLAAFISFTEKDMLPEFAAEEIRKYFPMFGDPNDTTHTQGDDRPLPIELKDRINKWLETNYYDKDKFKDTLLRHSTMNAFIRGEIKESRL